MVVTYIEHWRIISCKFNSFLALFIFGEWINAAWKSKTFLETRLFFLKTEQTDHFLVSKFSTEWHIGLASLYENFSLQSGPDFYRGFFPSNYFFFYFKSFLIIFDWWKKSLERKSAWIEMIM